MILVYFYLYLIRFLTLSLYSYPPPRRRQPLTISFDLGVEGKVRQLSIQGLTFCFFILLQ